MKMKSLITKEATEMTVQHQNDCKAYTNEENVFLT